MNSINCMIIDHVCHDFVSLFPPWNQFNLVTLCYFSLLIYEKPSRFLGAGIIFSRVACNKGIKMANCR